ncbi:aminotransferase class I/II-fold pyridoxal phosphate-dependent enzyme [Flavobacteriaceae bacterium R38]|nr:aminotransferase class I/II-fold pyridoxal phosphate-dependent enzyme [Flavobacteriaceae bacterium R38]
MSSKNSKANRRNFLKLCGLTSLPLMVPSLGLGSSILNEGQKFNPDVLDDDNQLINFVTDGLMFSPQERIQKLMEIDKLHPIKTDFYGNGGAISELEQAFAKLTGKEKAIFVPTGTMANQLAIKLLNKDNTKVIVPENSHIFRDEADAAQAVHNKRLIPVGKNKPHFNLQDLKDTIAYYNSGEVFKSGLGTIVIEHPVRRADGASVPLETIKSISNYCRENGYKLHLDGARIHIAAAYTKVSISEYASYFDTVYISLYKYLNASGGAILAGDAEIIDKMNHQIKIYGGTTYQNWDEAAMALHYLKGIEDRWQKATLVAKQIISSLNKLKEVTISDIDNHTNIYNLVLDESIDARKLAQTLSREYNILLRNPNSKGIVKFSINESILRKDTNYIINAWKKSIKHSRK